MKKNTWKKLAVFFAFAVVAVMSISVNSEAKTYWSENGRYKVEVLTSKKCNVTIKWKKQKNVDGYDIFRTTKDSTYKNGSWKKITSVGANTTTYTNKTTYGKVYGYEVLGYKKVDGKKHYVTSDTIDVYAFWGFVDDGYDHPQTELNISYDKIELDYYFTSYSEKKPKGYVIYRKSGNGKYKKIGTTKKTKYVDKKVQANVKYDYKVVAYTTIKGKKIYSQPNYYTLIAMNKEQTYKTECLTKSSVADRVEYKITSDSVSSKLEYDCYDEDQIVQFSYDGINWIDAKTGTHIELDAGKSLYLAFVFYDGDRLTTVNVKEASKWYADCNCTLNGQEAKMSMDFENGVFCCRLLYDYE